MTLDNDGNPHAPRLPSDPPPRRPGAEGAQTDAGGVAAPHRTPAAAPVQSNDARDATTARGVVRAILAALFPAERAAVIAAVLAWARLVLLAANARAFGGPGPRDAAYHAADVMADGPDRATLAAPSAAIVAAWWGLSARGVVRDAWRGELTADAIASAVEFLAGLGDGAGLDVTAAPHVLRCPMPAGRDGPVTRAELVSIAARAARELSALPGDYDDARDMTLAVLGALGGLRAETPAELVATMGHELVEVACVLSSDVCDERDRAALAFRGRCDAAVAMLLVAADAIRAASLLAATAPNEDLDAVTWPTEEA